MKKLLVVAFLIGLAHVHAQTPATTLDAAAAAMGVSYLSSVEYAGTGWIATFGQARNAFSPWLPYQLDAYQMNIDFVAEASREETYRTQLDGSAPADGTRSIHFVNGEDAWDVDGSNADTPVPDRAAARRLQIWLTPHGFIRAARAHQAKVALHSGRATVTFTTADRQQLTGIINEQNLVERVETQFADPLLGDTLLEVAFADYRTFGAFKFPTSIVETMGGHPILELRVSTATGPNATRADGIDRSISIETPAGVRGARGPRLEVASTRLRDGVWHITGGSHHSVLVEFKDYLVMIEAPQSEERSNLVIAAAQKLVPAKPIKYMINTHQHFDSAGGIRTYAASGTTIVTPMSNKTYYERIFAKPRTIRPDTLSQSGAKAVVEGVEGKRVLNDGTRSLELHLLRASPHDDAILVAYLPGEKLLVVPELRLPRGTNAPVQPDPLMSNLYDNILRLKLDVMQIVPLQGRDLASLPDLQRAGQR